MFTTSRFVKLCHATVLAAAYVAVPVNVHAAPAGAYSVAATSECLLEVLDRITGMFEATYANN